MNQASSPGVPSERREHRRYPYPQFIEIQTIDLEENVPNEPPQMVIGKHLSASGIGFFHEGPLAEKRVLATFTTPRQQTWSVIVELRWCRFVKHGWYDSGGRFVFRHQLPKAADHENPSKINLPTDQFNDTFQ